MSALEQTELLERVRAVWEGGGIKTLFVCIIRFSSVIKVNCANITHKQITEGGGDRGEELQFYTELCFILLPNEM